MTGRPKKDDSYTTTLKAPNGSGPGGSDSEVLWGQPVQISARAVPNREHIRKQVWDRLFADVCLRLEQTTTRHALAYPFESFRIATCAYSALYYRFTQQRGPKTVSMSIQKEPPVLYVQRGPNWTPKYRPST
jgi:hypothetical protein